jgi:CheY-like chemotaxis protein
MNVLFVDDSKERYYKISVALMNTDATLDYAITMDEALKLLATPCIGTGKNKYDYIFLDYDLGLGGSGRGVAEYIARDIEKFEGCTVIIHSSNPAGSNNMLYTLQDAIERHDRKLRLNYIPPDRTVRDRTVRLFYAPLQHADPHFLKTIGLL